MPTVKLTPSTYYLSNSSYLTVSNASNMYADTDSTTYATIQNTRSSTSSYYLYIRGFDFDQIPSAAVVSSFTVKVKANHSGGYAQAIYLYDGTSTSMGSSSTTLSTTVTTHTINVSGTWADLVSAGSDLGIRINCRRSSRNTTAYVYVYGAEIEVTYTVPDPRTVTTTLTGDGTISPSGANTYYDGDEFELTITPTNASDTVMVTHDGTDVTSQLVAHGAGSTVTATPDDVTTSGIQSGSSYAEYAVGCSAESPSSSGTSSNMYASSDSTGYAAYSFDFSAIPSNATIESIEVRCYGHRESSTVDSTHVSQCVLYSGSTGISDEVDFPSTSNSIITLEPTTMPTRSELDNVTVRHYVGYYGGLVLGISFEVTYSTGGGIDHYTYTFTVSGDATIAVTIGDAGTPCYVKVSGSWVAVSKAYRKVSGAWQEVALGDAFQQGVNYRKA